MRIAAGFNHKFTYEYWKPLLTLVEIPGVDDQIQISYPGPAVPRTGTLIPRGGGTMEMVSADQMEIDSELRNVRDAKGNLLTVVNGEPFAYFVTSVAPVLDAFGELLAWRHNLERAA